MNSMGVDARSAVRYTTFMADFKRMVRELPWGLITLLGAAALARPAVKIFGDVFGYDVSAAGAVGLTLVIAAAWVYAMVSLRVGRPVVVLAASGAVYAVLSVLLAVILQVAAPSLSGQQANIAVLLTAGLLGSVVGNVIYGAALGVIAEIIQKYTYDSSNSKKRK